MLQHVVQSPVQEIELDLADPTTIPARLPTRIMGENSSGSGVRPYL